MLIKEVETLLNIKRSTIRKWQEKGLFKPDVNDENNYRDFTDSDIAVLKQIIILKKAGLSLQQIQDVQANEISLQEVLQEVTANLEAKLKEYQGSLQFATELQGTNIDVRSMPVDQYWTEIQQKENTGEMFLDPEEDGYFINNIDLNRTVECPFCNKPISIDLEDYMLDVGSYERQMGQEILYEFDAEEYECDHCHQLLRISGCISEYPYGCFNHETIDIEKIEMENNNGTEE